MKKNSYLSFANISTIVNSIIVIIAGYIFAFLVSIFGVGIPITEANIASILSAIVFAIFSYYNAKCQNDFWDKDEDTLNIPLTNLNQQQIKAIQNFIDNVTVNVDGREHNKMNDAQIEEIDPASEYDDFGDDEDGC